MLNKQPNILLVFVDNQPAKMLGCSGNEEIHTPNLDRLAENGVRFSEAYCPNAMCSPCRASVLTGLMPSQHGVHTWLRAQDDPPRSFNFQIHVVQIVDEFCSQPLVKLTPAGIELVNRPQYLDHRKITAYCLGMLHQRCASPQFSMLFRDESIEDIHDAGSEFGVVAKMIQ